MLFSPFEHRKHGLVYPGSPGTWVYYLCGAVLELDTQRSRSGTGHMVALKPGLIVGWVLEQAVWTHPGSCVWTGLGKQLSPGARYTYSFLNREPYGPCRLLAIVPTCYHHKGLEREGQPPNGQNLHRPDLRAPREEATSDRCSFSSCGAATSPSRTVWRRGIATMVAQHIPLSPRQSLLSHPAHLSLLTEAPHLD